MRILLAVHAFPPRSHAGVEIYTLRLARALRALGHDARVLAAVHDLGASPHALRRREQDGVPVFEVVSVHEKGTLEATYDDPDARRAAAAVIDEVRPDVVHVQHLLNLSGGLLEDARGAGARVVFTLHDYWLSCPRDGLRMRSDLGLCASVDHAVCARCLRDSPYLTPRLQRGAAGAARRLGLGRSLHRIHDRAPRLAEAALGLLRRSWGADDDLATGMDRRAARLREALRSVDLFLAPTSFARDRAVELGVEPGRVRVSCLGAAPCRPRARRAGRRLRCGFIGTVAPHKGVHVLAEAFRGVREPQASLDIRGSLSVQPGYAAALRELAAGDARIRFGGPFAEGEQESVLAEIDVLVVPSVWWENSPLTVLEALAAGVPVVASAIGGIPELVPAGCGVLVPPNDVRALRSALESVVGGESLAGELAPLPIKTAEEGARDLIGIYAGPVAASERRI